MKIIAVDGPAGAGKGTVASALAEHFHLFHIDTGLFYRALAFEVKKQNIDISDEETIVQISETITIDHIKNPSLRDEAIASIASKVATNQKARIILTEKMRDSVSVCMNQGYKGVIMDGRDVGSAIYPEADLKLFITADAVVRADRRLKEMRKRNINPNESYYRAIIERDKRDQTRVASPMKKADGAIEIDTTELSAEETAKAAIAYVRSIFNDPTAA